MNTQEVYEEGILGEMFFFFNRGGAEDIYIYDILI